MLNYLKKNIVFIFGLFGIAAILIFIYQTHFNVIPIKSNSARAQVTLFRIKEHDLSLVRRYAGRVYGLKDIDIMSRIDGIIAERLYNEGQFVKKGDILFKLDPSPFETALAKAQANLDIMQQDFDRSQKLYEKKFTSTQDYQNSLAQYQEALSDVKAAQINLNYATITAPIDGYVSREFLTVGSLAHANTSILTHMVQTDPIYIEFALSESEVIQNRSEILSGKLTMPSNGKLMARIQLDNGQTLSQLGQVDFTDVLIDEKTAALTARLTIENNNHLLIPGQFVRLSIEGFVYKNVIAIPDQAVQQDAQSAFVYVVDAEYQIKIRRIVLGNLENNLRIVTQGLQANDLIIMEGMIKVKPGQSINFDNKSIYAINDRGVLSVDQNFPKMS